jgi:RHS repeat-associated protein
VDYGGGDVETVLRDPSGAVVKRTFGNHILNSIADGLSRTTSTQSNPTVQNGVASVPSVFTEASYDGLGRTKKVIDNVTGLQDEYEYGDVLGRVTKWTRTVAAGRSKSDTATLTRVETRTYQDVPGGSKVTISRTIDTGSTPPQRSESQVLTLDFLGRVLKLEETIDGAQAAYTFSYDPRGNLLQEVGPTATVSRGYDELGRLLTSTDGDRFTTTLVLDPLGNVTDQRGPHAQEHWTFSYDPFNQLASKSIDGAGTTPAANWSFLYNVNGVTVQEKGPLAIVKRTFNARSKVLKEERTPLNASVGLVSVFSYDGPWMNNQQTTDGSWHDNHTFTFDDRGRVTSSLEHWDASTPSYDYTTTTPWVGRFAEVNEVAKIGTRTESRSSSLVTDGLGNLISRTQANLTDSWTYDAGGLLSKLSPSGKPETVNTYSQGLLSSSAFGTETTSYSYFPDRRVKSIAEPSGRTRSFLRNARGLVSKETYGSEVKDYVYDGGGFLSSMTLANGLSDVAIWSYDHGPRGELRSVSQPSSLGDFTYGYNAAALLTSIQPPSGGMPTQSFEYDYLGRQTKRSRGTSEWSTIWANGEGTTTSPNGDKIQTLLDPRGRVARQSSTAGAKSSGNLTASFSYDQLDQLLDITEDTGFPTSFSYDGRSRLLSVNRTGLGQVSYTYTSSSELQSVSSPSGSLTYGYDTLDRVSSLTSTRGTTSVSWEPGGQHLASLSDSLLFERRCYDSTGRVSEVLNASSSVLCGDRSASILSGFSYAYDARGNRLSETAFSAGSQTGLTSYGYDKADRLTGVNYGSSATLYRLAGDGTRNNEKTLSGYSGPLDGTAYDNSPDGTRFTYGYNALGVLQKITQAGVTDPVAAFDSDNTGRILKEVRGATSKSYTWTANGRLAAASLVVPDNSTTPPSTKPVSVSYQYDARGLRIGKTGPTGTAKYFWGASELVEEQLPGNNLVYERIGDTVARVGTERVMHDGLGSVVGRVGASTTKYRFDAWGNYLSGAPGNTEASAAYAGQHWDDDLGVSYAQQRWYDPKVGRFLSEDPVPGDPQVPMGLHAFGYASGNPLVSTDPTGERDRFLDQKEASSFWDDYERYSDMQARYQAGGPISRWWNRWGILHTPLKDRIDATEQYLLRRLLAIQAAGENEPVVTFHTHNAQSNLTKLSGVRSVVAPSFDKFIDANELWLPKSTADVAQANDTAYLRTIGTEQMFETIVMMGLGAKAALNSRLAMMAPANPNNAWEIPRSAEITMMVNRFSEMPAAANEPMGENLSTASGSQAPDKASATPEVFYRAMSRQEYAAFQMGGGIKPRHGESFVSQDLPYVRQLAARHPELYEVIVKLELAPGTKNALLASGARSQGAALDKAGLSGLPIIGRQMKGVVHVKAELDAITYGLRKDSAAIFNERITNAAVLEHLSTPERGSE